MFDKDGIRYGEPFNENPDGMLDECNYRICNLLKKEKDFFLYDYDFGDGWRHEVILEKILPYDKEAELPHCVDGERQCPPEDVGGPPAYESFLEVMADKNHPDHEDMIDWIGGEFDPEYFNVDTVNGILYDEFTLYPEAVSHLESDGEGPMPPGSEEGMEINENLRKVIFDFKSY